MYDKKIGTRTMQEIASKDFIEDLGDKLECFLPKKDDLKEFEK